MSSADTETTEVEATDDLRSGLIAAFELDLGDAVLATHIRPGDDLWLRIRTDAWRQAGELARRKLGFGYFCFLSAIDWLPSPYGRYEDAVIDTPMTRDPDASPRPGITGGDTRFQVFARVTDVRRHVSVTLKVDVPDDTMTIDSWVPAYAGANWHERETWEMFGITFTGHPGLRHVYLPTEFEGNPLRKDFPLLARVVKPWPGIVDVEPMPGEPAAPGAEAEATTEGAEGADEPVAKSAEEIAPPEPPVVAAPSTEPTDQKPAVEAPVDTHGESASEEQLAEGERAVEQTEAESEGGDAPA